MMTEWQKRQAAECGCRGSDDMCPCQNVNRATLEPLRKRIAVAISDPGATEGYKGDRTLTEWQTDAVMRVLGQ